MGRYLIHRLYQSVFSLAALWLGGLLLMRALPGDALTQDETLDPQYVDRMRDSAEWLLGSFDPAVWERAWIAWQRTVCLAGGGLLVTVLGAGLLIFLVLRTRAFRSFESLCLVVLAMPTLVSAPLFVGLFAIHLGWLPWGGEGWMGWILPVLIVSFRPLFKLARVVLVEAERLSDSDAVLQMKSLGFPEGLIQNKYVLKESLLPGIAYLGGLTVDLLSGSLIVETLFGIQGSGALFSESLTERDLRVLGGLLLGLGTVSLLAHFLVDLFIFRTDPRTAEDRL